MKTNFLERQSKNVSSILSIASSVGVIATSISAVYATPKAIRLIENDKNSKPDSDVYTKKDVIFSCWKCYVPSICLGTATIFCILGSNVLGKKEYAALMNSYILMSKSYDAYKNRVKEIAGDDVHENIMKDIVKENCSDVHIYVPDIMGVHSLDLDNDLDSENLYTFYDRFSNRYFETTISRVLQAEYHLNRNFVLSGVMEVNRFYEFLGIETIEVGEQLGWCINDEMYWIDFDHTIANIEDGSEDGAEVVIIDMIYDPLPFDSY